MNRCALFAALAWSWLAASPASAQIAKLLPNEVEHCQNAQGRYDAEDVIQNCTKLIDAKAISDSDRFAALHWRVTALFASQDWESALVDLTTAMPLDTRPPAQAFTLGRRAEALHRTGKAKEALADIDRFVAIIPNNPAAFAMRGRIREDLGEPQAAVIDYDRALALDPNHVPSLSSGCMVRAWDLNVELAKARQYCDAAIRMNPAGPDNRNGRALIGLREGRYQEAFDDFSASLGLTSSGSFTGSPPTHCSKRKDSASQPL